MGINCQQGLMYPQCFIPGDLTAGLLLKTGDDGKGDQYDSPEKDFHAILVFELSTPKIALNPGLPVFFLRVSPVSPARELILSIRMLKRSEGKYPAILPRLYCCLVQVSRCKPFEQAFIIHFF